jgi:hypothetical protein
MEQTMGISQVDPGFAGRLSRLQDIETKKIIPCQSLPEGGSCFIADDLPSIGYRCFHNADFDDSATRPNAAQISASHIENEFYRIALNPKTGGIQSIHDKQFSRQLVDTNSEYDLGELIYVTGGEGTYAIHSDLNQLKVHGSFCPPAPQDSTGKVVAPFFIFSLQLTRNSFILL